MLKVGPESAGSSPGPACYGGGGKRPTVTDAFAVLGYIGQFELDDSAIRIDAGKARAAVATVAERIGRSPEETAQAIVDVAVSGMYVEVSKLISRDGIDHREFAVQAFGGAGPMLGCFLASELGMSNVVIPPTPGVLSALGGLVADIRNDFISTVFLDLDESAMPAIRNTWAGLEARARSWLYEEQGYRGDCRLVHSADMRYRGQSYEIETEIDPTHVARGDVASVAEAFHRRHEQVYEHADRDAAVQIINLRMVIVGWSPKPRFPESRRVDGVPEPRRHLQVFMDGVPRRVPLYVRADLVPGHRFAGPAVVAQSDCTTCVPGGLGGEVDGFGNLILAPTPAGH